MAPAIGNIIYTIYPVNAIFTASYSSGAYSFTFTNEDCTVVNDHLTYTSTRVNVIGTTTFTAYGKTYTVDTYDGAYTPTVYINIPPEHLYAWDYEGTTIYTDSSTPSNGSYYYYDNNGRQYEQYELLVGTIALFNVINSYDSSTDTINISGDPA